MKKTFRLPDGKETTDVDVYCYEWCSIGDVLPQQLHCIKRLSAFNPGFQYELRNGGTLLLPEEFVIELANKL